MKLRSLIAALVLSMLGTLASASTPNVQGRWEFVTLSGDSSTQLNQSGQSTISTYLLQSGLSITNLPGMTSDTLLDDQVNYNNDTITGTVNSNGSISLKFVIANPSGKVTLNYSGTLSTYSQHGADATILTGTYTSTGQYTTGGNFVATFFPDFTGTTYSGTLDNPDNGSGPAGVPASFSITTNSNHTVNITNVNIGAPLNACFTPPFHVIAAPGYPAFPTSASGVGLSIYLEDSVGGQLWLNAYSILQDGQTPAALDELYEYPGTYPTSGLSNVGTNSVYYVYYGITTNNSCNGYGGGDTPFQAQVPKHDKDGGRDQRRGHSRY